MPSPPRHCGNMPGLYRESRDRHRLQPCRAQPMRVRSLTSRHPLVCKSGGRLTTRQPQHRSTVRSLTILIKHPWWGMTRKSAGDFGPVRRGGRRHRSTTFMLHLHVPMLEYIPISKQCSSETTSSSLFASSTWLELVFCELLACLSLTQGSDYCTISRAEILGHASSSAGFMFVPPQ